MVWLPSSLAMGECAVGTQSILYKKRPLKKKRHRDNKNDSIMILSIVCKHMRGGLGCASFFYLNPTAFIRVLLSFFSLEIVLKIRVKHGEHNCCFRAMLLKSLLASIIILLFMCTWFISCFVSLSPFLLLLPFVHRMAERMQ